VGVWRFLFVVGAERRGGGGDDIEERDEVIEVPYNDPSEKKQRRLAIGLVIWYKV
jgi:hypothetical protein